jgi:general secretion pathway protein A
MQRLHAVTGGVPRLINVVCDGALLLGYGRGEAAVDGAAIDEVARDLGLVERTNGAGAVEAPTPGRWRRRLRSLFG